MFKFKGNNRTTVIKHTLNDHKPLTLGMLLKDVFGKKAVEQKAPITNASEPSLPSGIEVNHIAIALDGVVQDVMRTQNKFAALILSNPEFILFNPQEGYPVLGETEVVDGKLVIKEQSEKED